MGAGATLVAIIGGLLVTRYITLESELQAAQERLASAKTRLADAAKDLAEAEAEQHRYEITGELEHEAVVSRLIKAALDGNTMSISEVRDLTDLETFTDEEISVVLDLWNAEARKAVDHELWLSVPIAHDLDTWSDFKRARKLPIAVDQVWSGVYDIVAGGREEEAQKRDEAAKNNLPFSVSSFATLRIRSRLLSNDGTFNRDDRNRLVRLTDEARALTDSLRVEVAAAQDARSRISRPPGLAAGLVVLALLTIATVVVPVLFLVPTPATLTHREGVAVVATFLSAVVVLFGYMIWHVIQLRQLSSTKD